MYASVFSFPPVSFDPTHTHAHRLALQPTCAPSSRMARSCALETITDLHGTWPKEGICVALLSKMFSHVLSLSRVFLRCMCGQKGFLGSNESLAVLFRLRTYSEMGAGVLLVSLSSNQESCTLQKKTPKCWNVKTSSPRKRPDIRRTERPVSLFVTHLNQATRAGRFRSGKLTAVKRANM